MTTDARADAGRDRQGHLRGAPQGPLPGDGSLQSRWAGLAFTTSSGLSLSMDRSTSGPLGGLPLTPSVGASARKG